MDMCEQGGGTSQAKQGAALCAAGAQQKDEDGSEGRTSVCTSIHSCFTFSLLTRKLHNFHIWEDIALKLLCILYSIYSTRLQSTSTVEGLMYPWKSFFWKAFRIFYFVLDTNLLETADWKFTSHECENIGHSCGNEMAKPHCFMGYCHNRISRRGDNKIVVTV